MRFSYNPFYFLRRAQLLLWYFMMLSIDIIQYSNWDSARFVCYLTVSNIYGLICCISSMHTFLQWKQSMSMKESFKWSFSQHLKRQHGIQETNHSLLHRYSEFTAWKPVLSKYSMKVKITNSQKRSIERTDNG